MSAALNDLLSTSTAGASPPKKKKGLGAEMLSLLNAVTQAQPTQSGSRSDASSSNENLYLCLPYNSSMLDEHAGLLSWVVAIVEAMQRSSSKQLSAHLKNTASGSCSQEEKERARAVGSGEVAATAATTTASTSLATSLGRASFEVRSQREEAVFAKLVSAAAEDLENSEVFSSSKIAAAPRLTPALVVAAILETCDLQQQAHVQAGAGPIRDVKHTFLLTMR